MKDIEYEDARCVCCEKVYVNSFLMGVGNDNPRKYYIICSGCAETIYRFVESVKTGK